jgi:hypothetical protein
MANAQTSTADRETNQLVLHVEPPMPCIRDWTVWCGVPGTNPVTHEDGLLVGYGSTAEGALAHAKVRLTQVLATLEAKYRAGAVAADMRAWERNEFDLGSHERFCGGGH